MTEMRALRSIFTLAACAVLALAGAGCASELAITLPSAIEARAGAFYLGEYAEIEGEQEIADAASMASIEPTYGTISRADVIDALSSAVPGCSVALRMPEAVRVIPESRFAAEIRAMTSWKWRIDADGPHIDDTTDFTMPNRVAPGARVVMAKIADASGKKAAKQIKLTWYQPVVFSKEPLVRGERIDRSQLAMRIEVVGMNANRFTDASLIAGTVPRQGVAAMRPISEGDIDRSSAVRSGSEVTLISRVNGLGVEVKGIAMQRGSIGERIKVKNASSKKMLLGTVIEPGRVLLD